MKFVCDCTCKDLIILIALNCNILHIQKKACGKTMEWLN